MSNSATSAKQADGPTGHPRNGPRLIFAGKGRHSLFECAIDLIENHGADPESLLVVTPTDAAAHELTTRLRRAINALGMHLNPNAVYAGTFLTLCLRVLDENREQTHARRNVTVMDSFDQHYFLYQRLDDYLALRDNAQILGRQGTRWAQAQALQKQLNALTEQALGQQDAVSAGRRRGSALAACYALYLQQLEKANALDESTAQLAALRLLEGNGPALARLKCRIEYLIVDAQQQTSLIKERVLACFVDLRSLPFLADSAHGAPARASSRMNVVEFAPPPPSARTAGDSGKPGERTSVSDGVPWWLR